MQNAKIIGLGHYVPPRVVTNDEMEKWMDTSDEWIRERTGIKSRRWIEEGESIAGMSHKASLKALKHAGIKAAEIDLIVTASIIGDHLFPGNGCILQEKLGLPGVPAIDVRNACSGFLYALSIADKFLKTGTCKNALVVGAEIQSTSLDVSSRGREYWRLTCTPIYVLPKSSGVNCPAPLNTRE